MRLNIFLLLFSFNIATVKEVKVEKKIVIEEVDYSEYIRRKLNYILDIPEGHNYWEKKYKTKPYEDKLKEYLRNIK